MLQNRGSPLHTPAAACLPGHLFLSQWDEPTPPPALLPCAEPALLQSLPTQCGSRESSPDRRPAPETQRSRLPNTAPGPPCDTSFSRTRRHHSQTDSAETVPQFSPPAPDTPPSLPPPQCTTRRSPQSAPVPDSGRARTPACSESACQSECSPVWHSSSHSFRASGSAIPP